MNANNIGLRVKKNIDGVRPMTRAMRTVKVPVRNLDYSGRLINVTKRINLSDKTYSRLVYYAHLAHVDPRVKRLRDLREKYQNSTYEFVSTSFDRNFESRLHNPQTEVNRGPFGLTKKSPLQKLRRKFRTI